jgi:hypothetical protein
MTSMILAAIEAYQSTPSPGGQSKPKFEIDCIKRHYREKIDATCLLKVIIKVDEIRHRDAIEFLEQEHGLLHNSFHRKPLLLHAYIRPSVQRLLMQVENVSVTQNDIIRIDSRIAITFNDSNCQGIKTPDTPVIILIRQCSCVIPTHTQLASLTKALNIAR